MSERSPGGSGWSRGPLPSQAAARVGWWAEVCIPTLSTRTFGSSTQNRKRQLFRQQRVKSTRMFVFLSRAGEILDIFSCVFIIVNKLHDKNLTIEIYWSNYVFVTFTVVQPFRNFISLCSWSQPCESDQETTSPRSDSRTDTLLPQAMKSRTPSSVAGLPAYAFYSPARLLL